MAVTVQTRLVEQSCATDSQHHREAGSARDKNAAVLSTAQRLHPITVLAYETLGHLIDTGIAKSTMPVMKPATASTGSKIMLSW